MANHHIYRDLRPMKNILNGQKVFAKKISHAPYRYTLNDYHEKAMFNGSALV